MDNPSYTVATEAFKDGTIVSEVSYTSDVVASADSIHQVISRKLVRTQEEQIRQALIQLGWTPPPADWAPPKPLRESPGVDAEKIRIAYG